MKKINQQSDKVFSVSELNAIIKTILEGTFPRIQVRGEVSNAKRAATSGYWYFSLKDKDSIISCAYFKRTSGFEAKKLEDGKEIICTGRVSLYAPRGNYQLIIEDFIPIGEGLLQAEFEKLKQKLNEEGLFDEQIKRSIPEHPSWISVITSPSGAAIQDILNILKRRAPSLKVTIIPTLVQGKEAPKEIIKALQIANKHNIGEVIILARGGGSIEDLWCFNDENLAREIRKSKVPVISAVGHEIDFTISDFASDLRAPTPSAAAELVSKSHLEILRSIENNLKVLKNAIQIEIRNKAYLLQNILVKLKDPKSKILETKLKLEDLLSRIENSFQNQVTVNDKRLINLLSKLESLSPLSVLTRGYALIKKESGEVIETASKLQKDDSIEIIFKDNKAKAKIV